MAIVEQTASMGDSTGIHPPVAKTADSLGRLVKRNSARLGLVITAVVIFVGWAGRYERNITAEYGLGYALGIIGASMMAALLIYPMRKRIRALRILGATRYWFMSHMVLGIVGPVLILYHCNFSVSSTNSKVALFCTLLVAGSGIVGRYLYAQIHHGLYGEKLNLRSLVDDMHQSLARIAVSGPVTANFLKEIGEFSEVVLEPPRSVFESAKRTFSFAFRTRWAYLQMRWKLRKFGDQQTASPGQHAEQEQRLTPAIRREIREHLRQVRKVAHLSFFERLFSLWHILHLPFFFMLVISAIVHILAVNMY
jgi:hypothetical protein